MATTAAFNDDEVLKSSSLQNVDNLTLLSLSQQVPPHEEENQMKILEGSFDNSKSNEDSLDSVPNIEYGTDSSKYDFNTNSGSSSFANDKLNLKRVPVTDSSKSVFSIGNSVTSQSHSYGSMHYTLPSFCSQLPTSSLMEQDLIKGAFVPNHHSQISKLPQKLKASTVNAARIVRIQENLTNSKRGFKCLSTNGLFHPFQYFPSAYDVEEQEQKESKIREKQELAAQCRERFVKGVDKRKLKYEDPFNDDYQFPFPQGNLYNYDQEASRLLKWKDYYKRKFGPFVVGKASHKFTEGHTVASQKNLKDTVKILYSQLIEDWGDAKFRVVVTNDDYIAIQFDINSLLFATIDLESDDKEDIGNKSQTAEADKALVLQKAKLKQTLQRDPKKF